MTGITVVYRGGDSQNLSFSAWSCGSGSSFAAASLPLPYLQYEQYAPPKEHDSSTSFWGEQLRLSSYDNEPIAAQKRAKVCAKLSEQSTVRRAQQYEIVATLMRVTCSC
jgi:hypothetical protein